MGFASGSVSFRRFAVTGQHPSAVDAAMLEKLGEHLLRPSDIGLPEEVEYGWCGGRHVFDATFSFEHNVFAETLFFAMRVDTNKVPGELKKSYQIMEEEAAAATNPSGFISKAQKKEVKDVVMRRVEEDLRDGRFRRSKLVPILWDLPTQTVYAACSGKTYEQLAELFERTFALNLFPISAGTLASRLLTPRGRQRDYEDLRPTRFVPGPEGEHQFPEYPWVAKGPEPKDFVGNEFMLWLWYEADRREGNIRVDAAKGASSKSANEIAIFFDRSLDLDCSYGQTGKDSLRGDGPARMPEARDGLRSGKVPRKAGLILHANGVEYSLTLNGEALAVGSAKLPEVEDAENARVLFEERIVLLRDFSETLDTLFDAFLKIRASSAWEGQVGGIRRWINQLGKVVAAA